MKRTVVLVHDKGARVYINPSEDSIKELEQHGTVLINPDTSAVKMTPPELWMLKDGKLQPNPKKKSEQWSVKIPTTRNQTSNNDLQQEFSRYKKAMAEALSSLHNRLNDMQNNLAITDEKVNNSDDNIAELQDQLTQPAEIREITVHKDYDNVDFEKFEEGMKKSIHSLNEKRYCEIRSVAATMKKELTKQKQFNKLICWAMGLTLILSLII